MKTDKLPSSCCQVSHLYIPTFSSASKPFMTTPFPFSDLSWQWLSSTLHEWISPRHIPSKQAGLYVIICVHPLEGAGHSIRGIHSLLHCFTMDSAHPKISTILSTQSSHKHLEGERRALYNTHTTGCNITFVWICFGSKQIIDYHHRVLPPCHAYLTTHCCCSCQYDHLLPPLPVCLFQAPVLPTMTCNLLWYWESVTLIVIPPFNSLWLQRWHQRFHWCSIIIWHQGIVLLYPLKVAAK